MPHRSFTQSAFVARPVPLCSKWSTPLPLCMCAARVNAIHTSSARQGLEEFFPQTDDIIEEGERTGTINITHSSGSNQ